LELDRRAALEGRGGGPDLVVGVDGHERETVGVIEVTLLDGEEDLHDALLRARSESCVARIVDSELAGMSTAQSSGVMRPASASETVTAL
jgi:hypothetical protein